MSAEGAKQPAVVVAESLVRTCYDEANRLANHCSDGAARWAMDNLYKAANDAKIRLGAAAVDSEQPCPAPRTAFDSSAWFGASYVPHELKALKNGMEEALAAYNREREKRLWDAVMMLEGGRRPSNEEVARRGRRVCYPDGKTEWLWDKTIILTEPGLSERWRQGGGEAPNHL